MQIDMKILRFFFFSNYENYVKLKKENENFFKNKIQVFSLPECLHRTLPADFRV